jgi:hypothetical protein
MWREGDSQVEAKEGEGEMREGREGGRKRERANTVICALAGLGYGYCWFGNGVFLMHFGCIMEYNTGILLLSPRS